jgi:hypothetical protein
VKTTKTTHALFKLGHTCGLRALRTPGLTTAMLGLLTLCGACSSSDSDESGSNGGSGGSSGGGSGATSGGGGTPSASSERVGGFTVQVVLPEGDTAASTRVQGGVSDGPAVEDVIWELSEEQGGCQLFEPRVPFCDPQCENSICVEDDQCAAEPVRQSVGTVTVQGLRSTSGSTEFSMEAIGTNPNYTTAETFEYPPFAEGDPVVLSTEGGDYAPFQIESQGIAPLEVLADGDIPMESGQPLVLSWTPPTQAGVSTMRIDVDISHHGGQKGKIVCEVEDTGSLEVAEPLVTGLIALGYSGYPDVSFERRAVGSVEIEHGYVELLVVCRDKRYLAIPGLTSCEVDEDCPAGQTCQDDAKCG